MSETTSKNKIYLPDGDYKGTWSGWGVKIHMPEADYYWFQVNSGIRGATRCDILIKDFEAKIYVR